MKKNKYEDPQYMSDLKKLLKARKISPYDMAHESFRKNNSYWIINAVDYKNLTITYLNNDQKCFSSYQSLVEEVNIVNKSYPKNRRKYTKRYFRVVTKLLKHKNALKNKIKTSSKSLINRLTPKQIKDLANSL